MKIKVAKEGILSHKVDAVVMGVRQVQGSQRLTAGKDNPMLRKWLAQMVLPKGKAALTLPLDRGPFSHAHLVKVDKEEPTAIQVHERVTGALKALESFGCKSVGIDLASLAPGRDRDGWAVRVAAQAVSAAAYKFNLGMRMTTIGLDRVILGSSDGSTRTAAATRVGKAIGEGMCIAKHLGEQPPNLLYPDVLARVAKKLGKAAGLKVKVFDKKGLQHLGMNGLLTVGQGSTREPRLIVMRYEGGSPGAAPIVLVGKGITFDTGGNSLKPSAAMVDMKFDMCGAAGVLGTVIACARMRLPTNVVAVIPSAENMVAGNAFRPDDIIRMMDGQLVEVLNTDAEGRLILADALTYAQRYLKPKMIIDAATLTGACLVALGQYRCGMFATNDSLAADLAAAGEDSGDLCWRLPLDDAYDKLLKSDIADIQNIGGGRNAGTITAACFLQRFVTTNNWAHLDIAGSAWQGRRATGRPVPLLATLLARQARLIKS